MTRLLPRLASAVTEFVLHVSLEGAGLDGNVELRVVDSGIIIEKDVLLVSLAPTPAREIKKTRRCGSGPSGAL